MAIRIRHKILQLIIASKSDLILQQFQAKNMLLVDHKKISFEKRYQKVLHLSPAINDSIVFLGIIGHRQDCLTHMDSKGKVIKEKVFGENIDSFAMLSERQVMILETRRNNILIWNLETNITTNILFNFKTTETDQSQIFIFPEQHLVCIQENGRYNNNTFRLSYFHYPMIENQEPFKQQDSDQVWTYEYMVRKANNHSMVCWFKGRHDDGFEFKTYDLRDDKNGKYNCYKFPNDIGKFLPNNPKAQVAITTMWEMTPKKFMLVCISSLSNNATQAQKVNNNFVYTANDNSIRPAKFSLDKYADLHLDQHNFGNTCMFRTFDFEAGKPLQTPIFYINNETEQIIAQETWKCSYLHKYDFPGYDGNLLLDCKYENGNVEWAEIYAKKIMEPREISTHFMLSLIQDFDEDLLENVVSLTGYEK